MREHCIREKRLNITYDKKLPTLPLNNNLKNPSINSTYPIPSIPFHILPPTPPKCAPQKTQTTPPLPIENTAADQETLLAPPTRAQIPTEGLILIYSFFIWAYPFPKSGDGNDIAHRDHIEDIGHVSRALDRPCYDIVGAEEWPLIPELEERGEL